MYLCPRSLLVFAVLPVSSEAFPAPLNGGTAARGAQKLTVCRVGKAVEEFVSFNWPEKGNVKASAWFSHWVYAALCSGE